MIEPLISLKKIRREYPAGEGTIAVLKDIDLTIEAGEMVAIVGASGSGKSTLMNILGCLDRATSGSYRVSGRETSALEADELAALRREHFGFIFQRYHLLAELTALGNVEIPAIYAGRGQGERRNRAAALLGRLGMTERMGHRPGQLSGGQQQRVSIARALMNNGNVILADEPTGALDSHSGEEVLRILDELHAEGRTVIIVTHDMTVASRAQRIIEISDGEIIADRRKREGPPRREMEQVVLPPFFGHWNAWYGRFREACGMALLSMQAHLLRTFLTMLGIIIGITSVVCVVALGEGAQKQVLENIASLGTNTLEVFAGADFGDTRSGRITTLVLSDANELAKQPYVAAVTPTVSTSSTLRFGAKEASALINGVSEQYFEARGTSLIEGAFFDRTSVRQNAQEVVIDENTRRTLFGLSNGKAIGQIVMIGKVPSRVVGVIKSDEPGFGSNQSLSVYLPYSTVQSRFLGNFRLRSITVKISDSVSTDWAERSVTQILLKRHGTKDFFILNTDDIRRTITSTTETLALLIASIAVISLIVGGIGVMNIMLVSVSERVSEIGVRMAVGARQADIMQQFLIEAALVCLLGGILGIGGALALGAMFMNYSPDFPLIYSSNSILVAVFCSSFIGLIFGYLPARTAARLSPVTALAKD